jgi:hypothetical protein
MRLLTIVLPLVNSPKPTPRLVVVKLSAIINRYCAFPENSNLGDAYINMKLFVYPDISTSLGIRPPNSGIKSTELLLLPSRL